MSETPDEPDAMPMANYVVTCETHACGNEGIAIPISAAADNPYVVCGVCSQPITNITQESEATQHE